MNDDSISFSNGKLSASTYSYEISSYGYKELTEEETKTIYLQMKKHFEPNPEAYNCNTCSERNRNNSIVCADCSSDFSNWHK